MISNRLGILISTNTSPASEGQYATNFPRFEEASVSTGTTKIVGPGGYKIFISASGDVIGSNSTTSRQDSYRALNANANTIPVSTRR